MTFHPPGGNGSSTWFHNDDWLDFNMRQNGHVVEFTGRYASTREDYDRTPIKPVIEGEPIYEDHPVSFKANELGHSIAADVRRPLYWNLFTGACGHTYGHHSVWQMWSSKEEADQQPAHAMVGGDQPAGRRPDAVRRAALGVAAVPDPRSGSDVDRHRPRAHERAWRGAILFVATRDTDGTFAMVYAPVGESSRSAWTKSRARR